MSGARKEAGAAPACRGLEEDIGVDRPEHPQSVDGCLLRKSAEEEQNQQTIPKGEKAERHMIIIIYL